MAELRKQCVVEVRDEIGRLAEVTDKVRQAEINICALCAWVDHGVGRLMMVTDDHDKVCTAISPIVDECEFRDVVVLRIPDRPGALNEISRRLAEARINIHMIYATGVEAGRATVVLDTSNNAKAAELL